MKQVSVRHSALDAESPKDNEIAGQARNDGWITTCLLEISILKKIM